MQKLVFSWKYVIAATAGYVIVQASLVFLLANRMSPYEIQVAASLNALVGAAIVATYLLYNRKLIKKNLCIYNTLNSQPENSSNLLEHAMQLCFENKISIEDVKNTLLRDKSAIPSVYAAFVILAQNLLSLLVNSALVPFL